jgi:hypothetical protein
MNFCILVTYVGGKSSVHRRHFLTVLFTSYNHELQLNHFTWHCTVSTMLKGQGLRLQ